ncbi:DEAD/DEAH box helicase family protein [Paenarthrobacter sp. PAE-2]|uniref:helicase C-terminal domain-containing protein n=1 Tax=Paenarthrobacter sp. PAE-2 TaxID=2982532 RepID=UPI00222E9CE7|nr:helicase C-terminal domain-containing protein [Paenarthrobacter sp. PAE-2]MCW3765054.1 DEAD/DEAH box helicase family protein [Paenarthrobacter sp. PAE-2]
MSKLESNFDERLSTFESPTFKDLRPGQRLVLQKYAKLYLDESDLAIEMPTGEGKTLVALLIADYALDRGWSVAYLTGTRQLAEHVEQEAAKLGLDTVRFASKNYGPTALDDYHQAQAVGVMNYWVYFNSSPVPQPADLVIFDDAHLAEQPLSGQNTLRIPYAGETSNTLYRAICDKILARADNYPGLRAMREGTALPGAAPELISFSDWAEVSASVESLIAQSTFIAKGEPRYVWRDIQGRLKRCGVLIGPSAIEMRPYHPPTALNQWHNKAQQRLYMSATLGSMDDLQRRLGTGPILRLVPERTLPDGETGTRRLVLNPTVDLPNSDSVISWTLALSRAANDRAAWLCASNSEADEIERALLESNETTYRLRAGNDSALDHWVQAKSGHLITAGRYDGLDFPGDVCRLVFIVGIPQASTEFERFVAAYLGDATHMRHRVGQRVTQALGRANRTPSDKSLYVGLDPRFGQVLADRAVRGSIPDSAQTYIRDALELFETGWEPTVQASLAYLSDTPVPSISTSQSAPPEPKKKRPGRASAGVEGSSANHEITASTDLWIGSHTSAASAAQQAATDLAKVGEAEHSAFWRYVEAHIHFDAGNEAGRSEAKRILDDVVENGPRTAWFRRLAVSAAGLSGGQQVVADETDRLFFAWDEWIRETGHRLDSVLASGRLRLDGSHNDQCEGLRILARLCGASSELPPQKEQSATDCKWMWTTVRHSERRLWEVKTGKSREVPRGDVNQLLGQLEVEARRAPKARVLGCLLTPTLEVPAESAEAALSKISLIHQPAAVRLYDLLADRLRLYSSLGNAGSASARGSARSEVEKLLPAPGALAGLFTPSSGKVRTSEDVASLFPGG